MDRVLTTRRGRCGAKGTFVVAYGPEMESADVKVVKNLLDHLILGWVRG